MPDPNLFHCVVWLPYCRHGDSKCFVLERTKSLPAGRKAAGEWIARMQGAGIDTSDVTVWHVDSLAHVGCPIVEVTCA
jgi:hypothetical protein